MVFALEKASATTSRSAAPTTAARSCSTRALHDHAPQRHARRRDDRLRKDKVEKEQGKDEKGRTTRQGQAARGQVDADPAGARQTVDASKIEDVVGKITGLRADSFVEKLPAGAAELLTVNTKFDDGKKSEKVSSPKPATDYYAVRSDDAGAAKLATPAMVDAIKALDAAK